MDSLWPWLALAGAGALHGLGPAAGWMFVACGARPHDSGGWLRLLVPLAAAQAGVVLWPWLVAAARTAGWMPLPQDLCGPGSAVAASPAATWLALAATGAHAAGMLAGTAIAAALARVSLRARSGPGACGEALRRACRPARKPSAGRA